MVKRILPLALCAFATALSAQVTFNGMGNPNGAIGSGSMVLDDDGADLTIQLNVTTGFNFIPETLVLYVDSREGEGFTDNSTFTDNNDATRIAASGLSGGQMPMRAGIVFPAGFAADYAIVIENGSTVVLQLSETGTHVFRAFAGQTTVPAANGQPGTVTTVIPLSSINSPQALVFVSTYVAAGNSSRTNESHTEDIATDPGFATYAFANTATYMTDAPLPVSLRRFGASATPTGVDLTWETARERGNVGFAVERSREGRTWTEIGFVAGVGDAAVANEYDFRDGHAAAGLNYYRLRQVDYDGAESYSAVVSARSGAADVANELYLEGAHPARDELTVRNGGTEAVEATLSDATGRHVAAFRVGAGEAYRLDVSGLAAGTYVLRGGTSAQRLIVR